MYMEPQNRCQMDGGWDGQGVPLGNFLGFNHQLLAPRVDHGPTHLLFPFLVTMATKHLSRMLHKNRAFGNHNPISAPLQMLSQTPNILSNGIGGIFRFWVILVHKKSDVQFGAKAPRYNHIVGVTL